LTTEDLLKLIWEKNSNRQVFLKIVDNFGLEIKKDFCR
jgi:hypothetical protein